MHRINLMLTLLEKTYCNNSNNGKKSPKIELAVSQIMKM